MDFKDAHKGIEVPRKVWNKTFTAWTLFFSTLLISALYFILSNKTLVSSEIVFGATSLFFFYLAFLAHFLLCEKVGLKIDRFGFIILVSNPPIYVPRNHVINVSQKYKKYNLILVEVENPHLYIDNEKSFNARVIMKIKIFLFGTPFLINVDKLKIKYDDLINLLKIISNDQQLTSIIEF
jgi:hypothetical protein